MAAAEASGSSTEDGQPTSSGVSGSASSLGDSLSNPDGLEFADNYPLYDRSCYGEATVLESPRDDDVYPSQNSLPSLWLVINERSDYLVKGVEDQQSPTADAEVEDISSGERHSLD